jgi:hypothetical protein
VAYKAFTRRSGLAPQIITVLMLILLVPILLVNLSARVFFDFGKALGQIMPPPRLEIVESNTRCYRYGDTHIRVVTNLILQNAKSIVLSGEQLVVMLGDKVIGSGSPDDSFVLSDMKYSAIQFDVKPEEQNVLKSNVPAGSFDCLLSLPYALSASGHILEDPIEHERRLKEEKERAEEVLKRGPQ